MRRRLAVVLAGLVLLLGMPTTPASAVTGDVGFQGPSYAGTYKPASADKPESKLWYAHGSWWAVMWDTASQHWHIFRLDRSSHAWVDAHVLVDKRWNTLADVVYDPAGAGKLYVGSHIQTNGIAVKGNPARLMRYSWVNGSWKADAGFPTTIMNYSSESMTIDEDTAGNVWATWTQVAPGRTNGAVYVVRGAEHGTTWGKPFLVPAAEKDGNLPRPDDISTIVSFGKWVGVLWSNQVTSAFYWSVHADGAAETKWSKGVVFKAKGIADDHLNVKSIQGDAAGHVYAILKTDFNDYSSDKSLPQVVLGSYIPHHGWTRTTVWKLGDCVSRPQVVINTSTQRLYAVATAPPKSCGYSGEAGVIVKKSTPLDKPVFTAGRGTVIMSDAASPALNNVTGSKQPVTRTSGLVLLATNSKTKRYWFSDSLATK